MNDLWVKQGVNSEGISQPNFFPRLKSTNKRIDLRVDIDTINQMKAGPGYRGIIRDLDTDRKYKAYGAHCSFENCWCDVVVVAMNQPLANKTTKVEEIVLPCSEFVI